MRIKNNRLICILFVILTVLSGICFDYVKTDSFFWCASEGTKEYSVISADYPVHETGLCSSQQLIRSGESVVHFLSSRFANQKKQSQTSLAVLASELFSLHRIKYFIQSKIRLVCSLYPNEQITAYIQKTDGKKRIQI